MLNHKLVTPSMTNWSNRVHGAKHVAVSLRILLYYHLLSHREALFLNYKGPLYHILLLCLSQHRNQDWPLLCHILYFILKFLFQGLAQNSIFSNCFFPWNLSCLNICGVFFNVTGRVSFPPLFHVSRVHHLEKWLVTHQKCTMEHGYYFIAISMSWTAVLL